MRLCEGPARFRSPGQVAGGRSEPAQCECAGLQRVNVAAREGQQRVSGRDCIVERPHALLETVQLEQGQPFQQRDADGGAEAWIAWARKKAQIAEGLIPPDPPRVPVAALAPPPGPEREPVLEGVVLDMAAARKRARDEAFRASPDAIMIMRGSQPSQRCRLRRTASVLSEVMRDYL